MSSSSGAFVWHELKTTDAAAAAAFYCKVVGWEAEASNLPGIDYTRLMVGNAPRAGLMTLPAQASAAGATTGWTGYVYVDSVDETAARLQEAGGAMLHPPMDIPGIGRFATVTDPQGAAFALFQPASSAEGNPPAMGAPGTVGWNELHAADWTTAYDFYAALFGWEKGDTVDMRAMGTYQLFTVDGVAVGGMMTQMQPGRRPAWLYYFNVPSIKDAAARVAAEGGQVTAGPHPVPGGSWIIQCTDPQGGAFALVAPPD